MILTDEQCERFFDTMDSLLYYVNSRFQVVRDFTLDSTSLLDDMKTSIVAQTLWDNVEIIDEFVRENPAHLPQNYLDIALSWKDALPGFYTVVRFQGGRAIMMNETGVFSVGGVTLELEGEIGKAPAYVDAVLLPFEGMIVYDGFLQVYDIGDNADELQRIQDEFENRCADGIVSTGAEFSRVVGAYLAAERERDLESLLTDVVREAGTADETLPAGFHRGALAGLDQFERAAAIEAVHPGFSQLAFSDGYSSDNRIDFQSEQAINCAIASVIMRGVVAFDELYDQYCMLVADPLGFDEFIAVVTGETVFSDSYYRIWRFEQRDYLAYFMLTSDYLTLQRSKLGSWDGLQEEIEYYESFKRGLIKTRSELPMKPLPHTLLEVPSLVELLGDPSVRRLQRFLDAHIPDGQDDYTYADQVVEELAFTAIESGNLGAVMYVAENLGLEECTADQKLLMRLLVNLFNAMPSWENNGWSPRELYEQLTGRTMFYNDDGTMMRLAPGDPCPCGSGKAYSACHG